MISFDFEYYKPETVSVAVQLFRDLHEKGKTVLYYNGGTEFITYSRTNQLKADAVIDIKGIAECQSLEINGDLLVIGSSVSLNKIAEANVFPLLGNAAKQVADHTSRNKITIGGNLNSRLMYREAVLPLLIADAKLKIAGREGQAVIPLNEIYDQKLILSPEQLLVQILVEKSYLNCQYFNVKRTKMSLIGYPVVSLAALVKDGKIRMALSGVCEYPFRSAEVENVLNDPSLSETERIDKAVSLLPGPIVDDIQASADYREFVLKNALQKMVSGLKGEIA